MTQQQQYGYYPNNQVVPEQNFTTTISQTRIFLVNSAIAEFSRSTAAEIVLVTIPVPATWVYFFMTVPSGVVVLSQQFLKHHEILQPGPRFCWPAWNRVSHIVNRASLTYNCAVKKVPTADNIMIDIMISITFCIPDSDSAVRFVYTMGTSALNAYLNAKTDDAIRGLVRCVTHDKLNDLRSEFCDGMTRNLNNKCLYFGVRILNVKILAADLPFALQERLEKTTSFKTKIEEEDKAQDNRKRAAADDAEQKITAIIKYNQRKIQELTAECVKFEIMMTEMQAACRGNAQVGEVLARTNLDVSLTKARGALTSSKAKGLQAAEEVVRESAMTCQLRKAKADMDFLTIVTASESKLATSRRVAQGMIASAEAEMSGAKNLEKKRKMELEWEKLEALKELTAHRRILISGQDGSSIVRSVIHFQGSI